MAESDPALATQDAQTANVRVGGVENRLSAADRLAQIEARLTEHAAIFREREKAEQQAQTERQLAAGQVQQALQDAALASAKALEAALKNANDLELERVARVRDEVGEVKQAALTLVGERSTAQDKFEATVKERFAQVNEFRGSLEDLSKSMGTRRELETMQESHRVVTVGLSKDIQDLRSRLDVGPRELQTRLDEDLGAKRGEDRRSTSRFEAVEPATAKTMLVIMAIVGVLSALALVVSVVAATGGFG